MGYTQGGVFGLIFDPFDSLDGIGDIRKVDERAVPGREISKNGFYERKSILLLFQEIDQLNIPIFSKVPLKTFVRPHLEVLDIANVYIPCRTSMDSQRKSRGKRPRVLAPANLQSTTIER
jgi:hypothetical protein